MPHIVVCYDIVCDTVRARVMKRLREYISHVQKSVFEGELSEPRIAELKRVLQSEVDMATDTIRIYRLCRRCIPSTEVIGTGEYVEGEDEDEVI